MKSLKQKYKENLICGIVFLLLAIAVVIYARTIPVGTLNFGAMNSQSFPMICAGVIALLSIILIIQSILGYKKAPEPTEEEKQAARDDYKRLINVLLAVILVGLYVYLIKPVGYLISTAVFLFFLIMLVTPKEVRKPVMAVIVSIVVTILIYLIFRYGFSVQLPLGVLKNIL